MIGLGGGYLATTMNLSGGSSASQSAGVGFVYGRYAQGPWSLGAVAAYSGGQIDGTRAVPATGMSANGSRNGGFTVIDVRSAYQFAIGSVSIEPRAEAWYVHASEAGFLETGASLMDFAFSGAHVDTAGGQLALRASQQFPVAGWMLRPWIEVGARQIFSGLARDVAATAGQFTATVYGISPAPTAAVAGSGLNASVGENLDLFIAYKGQFSANQTGNAFSTGLSWRF
jgi:outer membrane autotransporter protein